MWDYIWGKIQLIWITFLLSKISLVAYYVGNIYFMDGVYIKHRRWVIAFFSIFMLFGITTSVFSLIMRYIYAIISLLLSLIKIDNSVVPSYFQDSFPLFTLDSFYNSFRGMVLMNYYHSNPIMLTFIDLLIEIRK